MSGVVDIWHFMARHVPGPSLYTANERTGEMGRNFGAYKNYHGLCERLRVVLVAHCGAELRCNSVVIPGSQLGFIGY